MKGFIDRMREAADVPGVSVVLSTSTRRSSKRVSASASTAARGRHRRQPDIIASNTKPLTTLLLARLVTRPLRLGTRR